MSSFDDKPINVPQGGPIRQPQEEGTLRTQDRKPLNAPQGGPPRRQPQEEAAPRTQGRNAYNSERPLDVQPTQAGGVSRGGQDARPVGKASLLDKATGKIEKAIGKITNNDEMQESGQLRETGGK